MAAIKVFLFRAIGPMKNVIGIWEKRETSLGVRVHEGDPLMPGDVLTYDGEPGYYRVESGDWKENEYHARWCLSSPKAKKIDAWAVA